MLHQSFQNQTHSLPELFRSLWEFFAGPKLAISRQTARMTRALLFGATGLVGGHCLKFLVENPRYERVTTAGRTQVARLGGKHTHQLLDFESATAFEMLEPADDVFCCLGTTLAKAGSKANFKRVDVDYVVRTAEAAKSQGAAQFLVVSARGANPDSRIFYNRIKGECERALRALGLPALHIFRPSLLLGERAEFRIAERLAMFPARALRPLLVGPLRSVRPVEAELVALSMLRVAALRRQGTHVYEPEQIVALSAAVSRAIGS